jgi:hypothetical protein
MTTCGLWRLSPSAWPTGSDPIPSISRIAPSRRFIACANADRFSVLDRSTVLLPVRWGSRTHRRFAWLQMFKLEHGAMRVTPRVNRQGSPASRSRGRNRSAARWRVAAASTAAGMSLEMLRLNSSGIFCRACSSSSNKASRAAHIPRRTPPRPSQICMSGNSSSPQPRRVVSSAGRHARQRNDHSRALSWLPPNRSYCARIVRPNFAGPR